MANPPLPIQSTPPDPEDLDLVKWFEDRQKEQVTFLDEAGKRLLELPGAMIGLIFAISAFGDKFPPAYFVNNGLTRGLAVFALFFFLGALLLGLATVWPRSYSYRKSSLTDMRNTRQQIIAVKRRSFQIGGGLFVAGCVCLAALAGVIIFS